MVSLLAMLSRTVAADPCGFVPKVLSMALMASV
jgi:hypothetical protein